MAGTYAQAGNSRHADFAKCPPAAAVVVVLDAAQNENQVSQSKKDGDNVSSHHSDAFRGGRIPFFAGLIQKSCKKSISSIGSSIEAFQQNVAFPSLNKLRQYLQTLSDNLAMFGRFHCAHTPGD